MSVLSDLREMGMQMVRKGLVVGPGGNISARDGPHIYLSPTGYDLDRIADDEWAVVELEKERQVRGLKPTCEVEMHLRIFKARAEVNFICHAHPATVIGLISGGRKLLPFTPDFVALVDRVAYVPFIVPAGTELAVAVEQAARTGVNAIALRNHGALTLGRTAREALARMLILEDQAKTQVAALAAGRPRALTKAQQEGIRKLDAEAYRRKLLGGK
jgi:L-fuculose-phosphate aldolase